MVRRQLHKVALVALLLAPVLIATAANAAAPDQTNQQRLELTIRYLQEAQNLDGGFAGKPGGASDPAFSAWVAYALAAASINPQDQAKPGGLDVYSYLLANTKALRYTTDFERAMLVALAAGTNPRDFGGIDLIEQITSRQLDDGSFYQEADKPKSVQVNTTAFAILPLSQVREPAIQERVARASEWLKAAQADNGMWGWSPKSGYSTDMTGAVLEALNAAGAHNTPEQTRAIEFLRSVQNDDGGFPELRKGGQTNAMSTAWAVQGLWSAGIDPRDWKKPGGDPLDAMASFQDPYTGAVRYLAGNDTNLIWSTAQVAPAFAGQALPVPPAPRKTPSAQPPQQDDLAAPVPADGSGSGSGGFEKQKGSGVIAGGGGDAAPLFSRPKAQSQGKTRDGMRDTIESGQTTTVREQQSEQKLRVQTHGQGRRSRTGSSDRASGDLVTGRLLGKRTSDPLKLPVAPGLRGAQRGGSVSPLLLATTLALLTAALFAGLLAELRTPTTPRISHP